MIPFKRDALLATKKSNRPSPLEEVNVISSIINDNGEYEPPSERTNDCVSISYSLKILLIISNYLTKPNLTKPNLIQPAIISDFFIFLGSKFLKIGNYCRKNSKCQNFENRCRIMSNLIYNVFWRLMRKENMNKDFIIFQILGPLTKEFFLNLARDRGGQVYPTNFWKFLWVRNEFESLRTAP